MSELSPLEKKKRQLEQELAIKIYYAKNLPHLHGWKWYPWAREFFESHNRVSLLVAGNQLSKSSTQIRKAIHWATDTTLWPDLWSQKPSLFWYFYPSMDLASVEFDKKWAQFLPSGDLKNHPRYGWKIDKRNKQVHSLHFNSGVTIYFKSYNQDVMDLQGSTVDAAFMDEELPMNLYDEIMFRLSASNGYFNMVFTATLGQDFWRRCMEPEAWEEEALPTAFKKCVSMYDCQEYEDGTLTHWTDEKIAIARNRCKNQKEVLKRVYGRFVKDDTWLKYEQFDLKRHLLLPHDIPHDWLIYAGVDIGSGTKGNHPGAICFVAVRPDYQAGRVFLGWRGDGVQTTAGDIMNQFQEMRSKAKLECTGQYYDWASKDFETIATRIGEPFQKAEKSHSVGEEIINVLFKNNMLYVYDTPELQKLAHELISLRKDTLKTKARDDLIDAMRYAITRIPWDFSAITADSAEERKSREPELLLTDMQKEIKARREFESSPMEEGGDDWDPNQEIEEWNDLYSGN